MKLAYRLSLFLILTSHISDLNAQKLVRDCYIGQAGSRPVFRSALPNGFIFSATDDTCGMELWFSDGTETGTYRLMDTYPGPTGSAFYSTYTDTAVSFQIIASPKNQVVFSDGTKKGTYKLYSITGNVPNVQKNMVVKYRNKYYISSTDSLGFDIIETDGTVQGTRGVIDMGNTFNNPENFTVVNDRLYFLSRLNTNSSGLYVSDGSAQGTVLLKTLGINYSNFVTLGNELYFNGNIPLGQIILYRYNISSNSLDTVFSSDSSGLISNIFEYKNKILFNTYRETKSNIVYKVYYSDGSPGNFKTFTFSDTSVKSCRINAILEFDNFALCALWTDKYGQELWKLENDGTMARFIMDLAPGTFSGITSQNYLNYKDGQLYFSGFNPQYGNSLWKYDPATENVTLYYYAPNPLDVSSYFLSQGKTYLSAFLDSAYGYELYSLEVNKSKLNSVHNPLVRPYPNPVYAGNHITIDGIDPSSIFRLYDLNGKAILLTEENGRILIPDYLRPGLYNLVIQENNVYQTIKIIIE